MKYIMTFLFLLNSTGFANDCISFALDQKSKLTLSGPNKKGFIKLEVETKNQKFESTYFCNSSQVRTLNCVGDDDTGKFKVLYEERPKLSLSFLNLGEPDEEQIELRFDPKVKYLGQKIDCSKK